jgi:hypothetical protein
MASLQASPEPWRRVVSEAELTSEAVLRVILEGGPADLPREHLRSWIDTDERIKVPFRGGYEHFQRTDVSHVYRWVTRTKVAE